MIRIIETNLNREESILIIYSPSYIYIRIYIANLETNLLYFLWFQDWACMLRKQSYESPYTQVYVYATTSLHSFWQIVEPWHLC